QNFSRNLLNITVATTSVVISRISTFFLNFLNFFLSLYFMICDYYNIKSFIINYMHKLILYTISLLKNTNLFVYVIYLNAQLLCIIIIYKFLSKTISIDVCYTHFLY